MDIEQKISLKINIRSFVICFFLYTIVFYFVSDTTDWSEYEARYKYPFIGTDMFFIWMTNLLKAFSIEYRVLFRIHIILSAALYALFTSKLSSKGYLFVFFILLTNFVAMGNMIRYYVAFPAFLCAMLYLFERKYFIHFFLIAFALINHISILMAVLIVYLFVIVKDIVVEHPVICLLCLNVLSFIALTVAMPLFGDHFILYFGEDYQSSLIGGIFAVASSVVIFLLLLTVHRNMREFDYELSIDPLAQFLFVISIAPFSFVLISLSTQIFSNRFISPMLIVWMALLCYIKDNTDSDVLLNYVRLCLSLLVIITLLWTFVVPVMVLNSTFYMDEAMILINSYSL